MALAAVRDLREHRGLGSDQEIADFETDVLAGFVLARASAGLTDSTIRNDTNHLELIRDWFGRPLWQMQPADADYAVASAAPLSCVGGDRAGGPVGRAGAGDHRQPGGSAAGHGAPDRGRAERRVIQKLVNAFKRVDGKENILFSVAEAALADPGGTVREVVFPAVRGGEATLRELVHEYRTKGPVYRRTVRTTLRASYTNHYRRGLIELLEVLEFRSNNTAHAPVIDALALVARYARAGNLTYYPAGESARSTAAPAGTGPRSSTATAAGGWCGWCTRWPPFRPCASS